MEVAAAAGGPKPRALMFRWSLWFMLANAFVLMLVSLRYLKMMPFPEEALSRAFLGLSYLGHFVSLALYVSPLVVLGIVLYPRRRLVFTLAIALELCLVLLVIIDSLVFAQYRFHLNGMVWNLLTSGAATDVLPVTGRLWLVLALAALLLAGIEWGIALCCWRWVHRRKWHFGAALAGLLFLTIVSAHLLHAWADANNVTSVTSEVRYLPGFKPLTMKRMLVRLGLAKGGQKAALTVPAGKGALGYPLEKLAFADMQGKAKNLVIIALESWRFDHLTPEVTPNIWRMSEQSWRFDNHVSSGNCTRFGIFGMFYGLYGTYWHSVLAEGKSPVLMRELERRNYQMGIFGSAPLVNPEFDRTVFADIRDKISLRTPGDNSWQRDRGATDRMVKFISSAEAGKPFFGFIFFDAPHDSGHPPEVKRFAPEKNIDYLQLNNQTDPAPYLNQYRNSLYYVDALVGEVLRALEQKKLLDDTVVVITGDHAQEFNDLKLNYWGHCGNFSRFQTQTPLVIHWPGKEHRVFNQVTSHVDLAPTLMRELFGCQTDPSRYSNGRFLDDTSPRPFTVVSSWDTFSINQPDRITVSQSSGAVEVLSPEYRLLKGAQVRAQDSVQVMEAMGRFFAH